MEFKTVIGKDVLLERLRKNRGRYVETRGTLLEVYKKKEREFVTARAEYSEKVLRGILTEADMEPYPPSIPVDRTDTYDMYITMVERHCHKTLEIDSTSFKSLYWDKWDFIREHIGAMTTWARGYPSVAGALAAYDR